MRRQGTLNLVSVAVLCGCSTPEFTWEPPVSHPAHPEAVAAVVTAPPAVLAADETPPPERHGPHAHSAVRVYPLDRCLVSGVALGSMGEAVTIVHEGRELRFCCPACVPSFRAEPTKYLRALDEALREETGHRHE